MLGVFFGVDFQNDGDRLPQKKNVKFRSFVQKMCSSLKVKVLGWVVDGWLVPRMFLVWAWKDDFCGGKLQWYNRFKRILIYTQEESYRLFMIIHDYSIRLCNTNRLTYFQHVLGLVISSINYYYSTSCERRNAWGQHGWGRHGLVAAKRGWTWTIGHSHLWIFLELIEKVNQIQEILWLYFWGGGFPF